MYNTLIKVYIYNNLLQDDRVYTFLDGLDDRLNNIRSDVLQMQPFPMVEQAYAHVRREAMRHAVMVAGSNSDGPLRAMLVSKSLSTVHLLHQTRGPSH